MFHNLNISQSLERRYVLAVGLIAFVLIASFFVFNQHVARGADDSKVINMSGKQRMLSQRIALLSHMIAYHNITDEARQDYISKLSSALETLKQNHKYLSGEETLNGFNIQISEETKRLIFAPEGLNENLDKFFNLALRIKENFKISGVDVSKGSKEVDQLVALALDKVLFQLDQVVTQYEKEALGRVQQSKDLHVILFIIGLVILTLEITFIFEPMTYLIAKSMKEIEDKNFKLKISNQELDDFAYIASHDLKEPLRGLANNASFLQEDYGEQLDQGAQKRLNRMIHLCARMEKLIDDLLYFSRLGRHELAIRETDLNEVIKDIISLMENTIEEENVQIHIPQKLPTIICDKTKITELYRNLITNAIKYNDKDTKIIEIGFSIQEDKTLLFYVKDNGIGIDPVFYESVFRIFKRLNEEDEKIRGSGVGLTFVKKIVERHNGRIWVDSNLGEYTTFYFTLNMDQQNV